MNNLKKGFVPGKITLLTLLLASMLILMGAAAVAPGLEPISRAFPEASAFEISLIVTLPALGVAITGFGIGYIADRFGIVRVYFCSLIVFVVAGLSGYYLNSFELILVMRLILGIGIAGISLATTGLIAEYYTGADRVKVIGYQSAAMGIGVLFLETVGGFLADMGWREPFLIYLVGVPILILALISVRECPRTKVEEKIIQVSESHEKNQKIAVSYLVIFLAMFMMFSLPTNMPFYVIQMGSSLVVCGFLLGILGVSQAICSLLYSRSSNKLSDIDAYVVSFALIGGGCCLLYVANIYTAGIAMIFVGFGMGLVTPTVIGRLAVYSQTSNSGKVMGGYSVAFNMGVFCSSLFLTPIIEKLGSYSSSFLAIGMTPIAICVLCLLLKLKSGSNVSLKKEPEVGISESEDYTENVFKSILIATDGSENSRYAVKNGFKIAKKCGSDVTVLYVFDAEIYVNSAGDAYSATELKLMEDSVSKEAIIPLMEEGKSKGLKVNAKVLNGHPANMIIEESRGYDLVVCGSLGRTNISRVVMGSVAEKVARSAYCPVLICRRTGPM